MCPGKYHQFAVSINFGGHLQAGAAVDHLIHLT